MSATLLQPVLPWSGAQEEDRRFHRILMAVLVAGSLLSAMVRLLPVPPPAAEPAGDIPPVVRVLPRPVSLPAPPSPPVQAAVPPAAPEQPSAAPAEAQAPVTAGPPLPPPAVVVAAPPTGIRAAGKDKQPDGQLPEAPKQAVPKPPPPVDPSVAARKKAAKSGVLAFSDSLAALREFNPSIPVNRGGPDPNNADKQPAAGKLSSLGTGMATGSGGLGRGIPGARELFGRPVLQQQGGGGVGGLAALRSSGPGSGGATGSMRGNTRSEEEIQEVLDRHKSAIYTLYERELRKVPTLQGKVVVSITIAPSGRVTDCSIDYSELESDSLQEQLIRLIKGVDFGAKPDVPPVTTKVPIEFFPV